jgi:GNAT superfamily N-acetyltransferase
LSSPYTARPATEADKPQILALLGEHNPKSDAARRWTWLYEGNPEGRALTWVAVDDASGELAGITSYFPLRLWVNGEVVRAAIGGDGYVRPKFRRRGIAGVLHAALREQMPKHGIEVMFGAPAAANVGPLQHGHSRVVGEMVRFVRPLTASAIVPGAALLDGLARRLLRPRAGSAELEPVRGRDPRMDEVWAATRPELEVAAVHDASFYEWRFGRAPAQVQKPYLIVEHGRPIGMCALQDRGDRLHVVDLTMPVASLGAALTAIARAARSFKSLEVDVLRTDAERRALWRHGFVPREPRPYLIVISEASPHAAVLEQGRRWTYTFADLDMDRL